MLGTGLVSLAYMGSAHISGATTDGWIAERLVGEELGANRSCPDFGVQLIGEPRPAKKLGAALVDVADRLNEAVKAGNLDNRLRVNFVGFPVEAAGRIAWQPSVGSPGTHDENWALNHECLLGCARVTDRFINRWGWNNDTDHGRVHRYSHDDVLTGEESCGLVVGEPYGNKLTFPGQRKGSRCIRIAPHWLGVVGSYLPFPKVVIKDRRRIPNSRTPFNTSLRHWRQIHNGQSPETEGLGIDLQFDVAAVLATDIEVHRCAVGTYLP